MLVEIGLRVVELSAITRGLLAGISVLCEHYREGLANGFNSACLVICAEVFVETGDSP